MMERSDELKELLMSENLRLLIDEIQNGKLDKEKVKMIAMKMNPRVHGVFKENQEKELSIVMRYMLDRWYEEELYAEGVDGLNKLITILEDDDIRLKHLAQKMKL